MTFSGWAGAGGCTAAGAAAGAFAGALAGLAAGAAAGAQAAAASSHPSTSTLAIHRPERRGPRARIFVLPRASGAFARHQVGPASGWLPETPAAGRRWPEATRR